MFGKLIKKIRVLRFKKNFYKKYGETIVEFTPVTGVRWAGGAMGPYMQRCGLERPDFWFDSYADFEALKARVDSRR